ncbi:hypothetical protein EV140_1421 [Microcella alkaliphila]|uniref:Uncharacterized protein n=1 Tax=Microcella alkaliphila TaxID=279828 RepID=A0A4Q7TJT6_9MICO|nr:hypothetical protein EV140_1421 [Microcella alkaliphila]
MKASTLWIFAIIAVLVFAGAFLLGGAINR